MPITPVVSTEWLARHLNDPALVILDASWYLPSSGRHPALEYHEAHVPGAVFFDLDAMSDHASPLPHMLPDPIQFAHDVGQLGVGNDNSVVVYDTSGTNLSAARVWWMFRAFGHEAVSVLDGGMRKWVSEKRPVEPGSVDRPSAAFTVHLQPHLLRDLPAMVSNLASLRDQVLDARSTGRFAGTEPEPRTGLRGGHLPGSHNLPFNRLVRPDGTLLTAGELRQVFEQAGVDPSRPIVATCGSGTSACALLLGLHALGYDGHSLYDGSWTEWGGRSDTPVETGPP